MIKMSGPHQDQPLVTAGAPLDAAEGAVVLVHGRGATANSIIQMADEFYDHGIAYLAPQAANSTWYPRPFTAPVEANEPGRTSGLDAIGNAIETANAADVPTDRVMILGFSQGACLASEFAACRPRRFGGIVALSGGLIGESIDPDAYDGDLDGTPVFIGCSDVDPHIPEQRVHETVTVLEELNGAVEKRIYEGMGHGINQDEIDYVSEMVSELH